MSLQLKGHYESQSSLIEADQGQVRTGAPLIQLLLVWPELTDSQVAAITAEVQDDAGAVVIPTAMIDAPVQQGDGFLLTAPLPEPMDAEQALTVKLTSGALTGSIPVMLSVTNPMVEDLHASAIVLTQTKLYFTLAFRIRGDLSRQRASVSCQAGHSTDPKATQWCWSGSPSQLVADQFLQVEVEMDAPLVEEFVHLLVTVVDSWGNAATRFEAVPMRMLLTQAMPPSRLDYDHAVQEIANMLPVWTASRARDYLALAHDPAYTMKGSDWQWLGELKDYAVPYDFTFPPVSQRLSCGLFGQHARYIRRAIDSFSRSLSISRADTGSAGHLYSADLPPEMLQQEEQVIPSSSDVMTSKHWDMIPARSWQRVFPSEVSPYLEFGAARLTSGQPLSALILRAECRVETSLGSISQLTSPAWTPQQNLEAMSGAGSLGLVWRQRRDEQQGSDRYWLAGWGWQQGNFGIFVKRVIDGVETLLYRDMEPRFYPKNEVFTLEVRDSGSFVEVYAGELLVTRIETPEEDPGHAGVWAQAPEDAMLHWMSFFGSVMLRGVARETLIGVSHLSTSDGLSLKEVRSEADLLEAAPTHLEVEHAALPVNGIRWGREIDPDRLLIEADKSKHRVVWWCSGNQVIKGEDHVGEPLFRYWIWDPDSKARPLTDYELTSCVLQRRWLWVLGRHHRTGKARVFIVDPCSPAPLFPESCLWCESAFDLDILGAAALARSKDSLEVFIQ